MANTNKAQLTETIAFRVPASVKRDVEKKHKGFEGRKLVSSKLRAFYATLLQR
jgi:hypothetical protein